MSPQVHRRDSDEHFAKLDRNARLGRLCYAKNCTTPATIKLTVYRKNADGTRNGADFEVLTCGKGHHRLKYQDSPMNYGLVKNESLPPIRSLPKIPHI